MESKTIADLPVFNKINLFAYKDRDIWMMNQSHHGAGTTENSWDRLAIVVDKTTSPKTARFYQIEPGPLEWKENLQQKPFRISCFMCHNNGPRAIRPNFNSVFAKIGTTDRIKIGLWNLRIKLYGRILASQFPRLSAYENGTLNVATCIICHREHGLFSRGFLHRQQISTIRFMVESGQMPPLGFFITPEEKEKLNRFLMGF